MNKEEVEKVIQRFDQNDCTLEELSNELMLLVFNHKAFFGLTKLDEDQFMEFLIYQKPKFNNIINQYDRSYNNFLAYLYGGIRSTLHTWKKRMVRNNIINDSLSISGELFYEEEQSRYILPEDNLIHKEELAVAQKQNPQEKNVELNENETEIFKGLKNKELREKRILTLKQDATLILALKSSYYLDESLVHKVSVITGYNEKDILRMRDNILVSLNKKIKRRNDCLKCRDNAYYFHRKYLIETNKLDKQTLWSDFINKKYNKMTDTWRTKNNKLCDSTFNLTASNCAVGKELGISPRHVFYILKQAKQNMDIIKLK